MRTFVCILVIVFLFSCKQERIQKEPENLISKESFKKILLDVNLLEAKLTNVNVNDQEQRDESLGKYKFILEKHKISFDNYEESYNYYAQQDFFKTMIEELLEEVNVKVEKLANIPELKQLSFSEFKKILKRHNNHFKFSDKTWSHKQHIDTINSYYKSNLDSLKVIDTDSVTFFYSLQRYKQNKRLFQSMLNNINTELK